MAKKVIFRHTKNLCAGTLFEEDGIVWRVVESKSKKDGEEVVSYCDHFEHPDEDPPIDETEYSEFKEVQEWHKESRVRLAGIVCLSACMYELIHTFVIAHIHIIHVFMNACTRMLSSTTRSSGSHRYARHEKDY